MVDPISQSRPGLSPGAEPSQHRLWPREPPTRRLVVLTLLGGGVLTLLAILSFWQVIHSFSLIDAQRQRQETARAVLRSLTEFDWLLREGTNVYVGLVRAHMSDPTADFSGPGAELEENVQKLNAAMADLGVLLKGISSGAQDRDDYQQMQNVLAVYLLYRGNMVKSYLSGANLEDYYVARDSLQILRTEVASQITKFRTRMDPELDSATNATNVELKRTLLVSCAALAGSGFVVLILGWMLVLYVYKRDQTEADLRRTRAMWIGTLNTLKQGVALYGYDRRLILWNPRYAELHGIDPGRMRPGMNVAEVMQLSKQYRNRSLEDALGRRDEYLTAVRRGEVVESELQWVDDTRVNAAFHPMSDDHFVLTLTDMTQVRRAEQLARDQAVRLGTIMDNVPDAIVTINASGSIESWNAAAGKMFGYSEPEIILRNVSVLMSEPHASQHDYYIRRYLSEGDGTKLSRLRELTARRQDGTEFPIDLRISEMRLGDSRMFTGIIRDITERRAIEQMKNEFISTVSHELRTPLTSIIGSLSLVVDGASGELPDKARRLILMAEKNSQRLGRLINDILDLEKSEAGRMSLRLELIKLMPLLQQSLELNQSYAARFDVTLRLQSNVNDIPVRGDEARLLQVMSNLLSNAIKHSPPQSQVLVDVTQNHEFARVTVHDAGSGIAEEFKGRVFQRFAQADASDARREAGTGLGLAITKQLVEQHGGHIGFDTGRSRMGDGRGASFWFELPLAPTAARPATDVAGPLHMNVLLCEDDPDVAEVMIEMLQHEGCSVGHVGRAASVRAQLDDTVSALLVDIDLPDANGLVLVAELRRDERWRKLPVLVVSGRRMTADEQVALEGLGVSAWLAKPVDRGTLCAALWSLKPEAGRE